MNKIIKGLLKLEISTIRCVLCGLFWVLLIAIVLFAVYHFRKDSLCAIILNVHFLKDLLIACFSVLTLFVAGKQLKKRSDMAAINALVELRTQLTTECNRNVHFALLPDDENTTFSDEKTLSGKKSDNEMTPFDEILKIDIFNYLGTIELGALMVEKDIIDIDTFYNQMGYRVENIFANKTDAQKKIYKHIHAPESTKYYEKLIEIGKKVEDLNKKQNERQKKQ